MGFTQIIRITDVDDEQAVVDHLAGWDAEQAGVAPGYLGARLLAGEGAPGEYLIEVDFSSQQEAERNSARPETATWADGLRKLVGAEPDYGDYRRVWSTER